MKAAHRQLVTLSMLRELRRNVDALRKLVYSELGDEVIDRQMTDVIVRIAKYADLAASKKTQCLTPADIERAEGSEWA